jgi:spermidine/putrescine transport system ATP-binding protein
LFDGANSRIGALLDEGTELTVRLPQTPEFVQLRPGDRLQLGWMGNQAQYFAAPAL